jgi:hypothetical protein
MLPLKHVYAVAPIDNWFGWDSFEGFVAKIACLDYGQEGGTERERVARALEQVSATCHQAETMARAAGWEGDRTVGPCFSVLPLPNDYDVAPIVAWKQPNNGSTFVMSAFPLPYLEGL